MMFIYLSHFSFNSLVSIVKSNFFYFVLYLTDEFQYFVSFSSNIIAKKP
jgi:hypothetical protein